ncbi:MAG: acetyltransferase [Firmicutes bacterium]|nr:acetyltransferase [Bacillota bacterium]
MKNNLIIVGAGGHGKVVADIAKLMSHWQSIVYLDDDLEKYKGTKANVIGTISDAYKFKETHDFFVAIGSNCIREKISNKLIELGCKIVTIIHPQSIIGSDVEIGLGTVIMAGVVVNNSSKIGFGCILNTSSSIDHENIIDDYVHLSPGVRCGGNVTVGKRTWLGIGSVVVNNVRITNDCIIGAAGLVIKDVIDSGTYIGVPIKRLQL